MKITVRRARAPTLGRGRGIQFTRLVIVRRARSSAVVDDARDRRMARATSTAATTSSRASADGAFVHFLARLPAEALDDLYARSPWAPLAVLRALDSVAKQIALRLIYVDGGCEETSLWRWCEEDGRAQGRPRRPGALGQTSRGVRRRGR